MTRKYPRFHYRAGYCRHGVYTGGCGIDWMCGRCEAGDDGDYRDEYRYNSPTFTISSMLESGRGYSVAYRKRHEMRALGAMIRALRADNIPFEITKSTRDRWGRVTEYRIGGAS